METKREVVRDVTKSECHWLDKDIKSGDVVYIYTGPTCGCIDSGVAVTREEGKTPFFEIPYDAIAI